MKKILTVFLIVTAAKALAGVSIGGGSGSSKAATELTSVAFSLDRLPAIHVDAETLRRAEARLSTLGMETVEMPVEGSPVSVRKLSSAVVDTEITRRFISD
ncbi:MAG TPA: hypothetical protein VE944_33435 [Nostoc sp.]|uniref:hypothetical protein n=1 Tax=Nostoc sp. TaxID=1180 RepID=UPI002D6E26F1|nr:hypothetical protein [Nostoc sp.]HYX19168.1 hypothetical protein [Nostoc sp.]